MNHHDLDADRDRWIQSHRVRVLGTVRDSMAVHGLSANKHLWHVSGTLGGQTCHNLFSILSRCSSDPAVDQAEGDELLKVTLLTIIGLIDRVSEVVALRGLQGPSDLAQRTRAALVGVLAGDDGLGSGPGLEIAQEGI